MRLHELKPSHAKMLSRGKIKYDSHHDIEEWLYKHGYKHLGRGSFGVVFGKADSNIAIKLNKEPDDCYKQFANYAYKNFRHNSHLPKMSPIRNIGKDVTDMDQWIVFMEKLLPMTMYSFEEENEEEFFDSFKLLGKYLEEHDLSWESAKEYLHNYHFRWHYEEENEEDLVFYYIDKHESLIQTILEVMDLDMNCMSDLALRNFMVRPSTNEIVITDPLYY